MKKLIIAAVIAVYFLTVSAFAQVKPGLTANNHPNTGRPSSSPQTNDTRARVMTNTPTSTASAAKPVGQSQSQTWGNAPLNSSSERPRHAVNNPVSVPAAKAAPVSTTTAAINPTQTYRVGAGDILDIQIEDSLSTKSTLYTVTADGTLDYPLASRVLTISGLTPDAIAAQLRSSIKVLNNPPVTVKVRDFASHTVNVIGFVSVPGTKVLRREAVPLYVIISESMPLLEATTATVVRDGRNAFVVNLKDANAANQLVMHGDLIRVSGNGPTASAAEFFFAGGEVNAPGQKAFHAGLTLTQSIIASGGTSLNAGNVVRVFKQNSDGRLTSSEYNLNNIKSGKTPDPLIQKGDRIEVGRN